MFLCCLVSSLSPIVSVLLQCFQLTGLRLSFFLICDPPRPRTVWLVLRSVVPYRSLFFFTPLFASSLSTLNWPLGPATVYLSSKGSLLLQTYHPSPSDLSLTGYFTAQASFCRRLFSHLPHTGLFTALSFWLRFLGRLFRRPLFAARLHATGYLGGQITPYRPAVHLCLYRTGLGPVFLGGSAIPTPSWLSPANLRPVSCATSGSSSSVASPVGRLLDPFSYRLFDRSRGVGPLSTVRTEDFPFVIFLHIRNLPTSRLLGVGTRAPRVLPPPTWDLSAIGN